MTGDEVRARAAASDEVLVTHRDGIYDVTDFVAHHPGCEMILAAKGESLEEMWSTFQMHLKKEVWDLLETMRIGTLAKEERTVYDQLLNPFSEEPVRSPYLSVLMRYPYDAETPMRLLAEHDVTPNDLFYVRNHFPVPLLEEEDVRVSIDIPNVLRKSDAQGRGGELPSLSIECLREMPQYEVEALLSCSGFRAKEMTGCHADADGGQMGNARWRGVRLRDILLKHGLCEDAAFNSESSWYAHLKGFDGYEMSIPLEDAASPCRDVLLALEMNGEPLPRDHGAPVRVIVPGMVGARSVKWLQSIELHKHESNSPFHKRIYRQYSPSVTSMFEVNGHEDAAPPCHTTALNSLVLTPCSADVVKRGETVVLKGVALPSGGRRVVRVEVSTNGTDWQVAELRSAQARWQRFWAWVPWRAELEFAVAGKVTVMCRAIDETGTIQPCGQDCWNHRGYQCNSYHTVELRCVE